MLVFNKKWPTSKYWENSKYYTKLKPLSLVPTFLRNQKNKENSAKINSKKATYAVAHKGFSFMDYVNHPKPKEILPAPAKEPICCMLATPMCSEPVTQHQPSQPLPIVVIEKESRKMVVVLMV